MEQAVREFSQLPGIGSRSALRMVLHLLKQPSEDTSRFGSIIGRLANEVRFCRQCHNISDAEWCSICSDNSRDKTLVCVVEDLRDLIAIESTQQYRGLYHILGGILSPMDGIGPSDLNIDSLLERINQSEIREVIIALSITMEGDTTAFYLYRKISKLEKQPPVISTLARGVSIGDDLEYTDEITLGRSIINRTLYESTEKG